MILPEHMPHILRMEPYFKAPMLMLGNQENKAGYKFPVPYDTLDLDGGDIKLDLNQQLVYGRDWETVFNLGTLEHVWNVHQAYLNAGRAVKTGGYFLGHSPVAGYEGHCIHITGWKYLLQFFELNGFQIVDRWFSEQGGRICDAPSRNCGRSIILWFVAKKITGGNPIRFPQQVYMGGVKNA